MIRHAHRNGLAALPVLPLPVTMIEPAFLAPLMTTIGAPPLPTAIMLSASFAAIALPAIAVAADEEDGVAIGGDTRSLPQR